MNEIELKDELAMGRSLQLTNKWKFYIRARATVVSAVGYSTSPFASEGTRYVSRSAALALMMRGADGQAHAKKIKFLVI